MLRVRDRVQPHAPRPKRHYNATGRPDWDRHPDIDACVPWLQRGGIDEPPPLLHWAASGFHRPTGPRDYGTMMVWGGGGMTVTENAPKPMLNIEQLPERIVSSSAGTYAAHAFLTAQTPQDVLRALAAINGVPFSDILTTEEKKYGLRQASAQQLLEWDLARTNGATFGDVQSRETAPGLEGWDYDHNVTVSVGFVHADKVKYLGLKEPLKPGETAEVSLFDALIAAFLKRGTGTYMRQWVFPRDMYSHDPNNPDAPGPMAAYFAAMIGSLDIKDIRRWVNNQCISTWNVNSSRPPLAMKALAVGLPGGHVMIIADGQMLGPPPLLREGEVAPAKIFAARTGGVDRRRTYANREILEIDVSGAKMRSVDFASHTDELACSMTRRGIVDSLRGREMLQWSFGQPWTPMGPPDPAHMPMTYRTKEKMLWTLGYNARGLIDAGVDFADGILADVGESRRAIQMKGMELCASLLAHEGFKVFGRERNAPEFEFDLEPAG